ncbi:N-6 DNA methylase [Mycoplasma sp. AC157]
MEQKQNKIKAVSFWTTQIDYFIKNWNIFRKLTATDFYKFKHLTLYFAFYKYLSRKQEVFMKQNLKIDENAFKYFDYSYFKYKSLFRKTKYFNSFEEIKNIYKTVQNELGYFIFNDNLFSTLYKEYMASHSSNITFEKILERFELFHNHIKKNDKYTYLFSDIFYISKNEIEKNWKNKKDLKILIEEAISVVELINIDYQNDHFIFKEIFEFLISEFSEENKNANEGFYTPNDASIIVSKIVLEDVKNKDELKIYDPTAGTSSLMLNVGKTFEKYKNESDLVQYNAIEIDSWNYNISRMNFIINNVDFKNWKIKNADSFTSYSPNDLYKTNNPKADVVLSHIPNSKSWNSEISKNFNPYFKEYGTPPKTKADWAFILQGLYNLDDEGIMVILAPESILTSASVEKEIRKKLVLENHLDSIIYLQNKLFSGTSNTDVLLIFKKNKINKDIFMINATNLFVKLNNDICKLSPDNIENILNTYKDKKEIKGFSKQVSIQEITSNNFDLQISKYITKEDVNSSNQEFNKIHNLLTVEDFRPVQKYFDEISGLQDQIAIKVNNSGYKIVNAEKITLLVLESKIIKKIETKMEKVREKIVDYFIPFFTEIDEFPENWEEIIKSEIDRFANASIKNIPFLDKEKLMFELQKAVDEFIIPEISVFKEKRKMNFDRLMDSYIRKFSEGEKESDLINFLLVISVEADENAEDLIHMKELRDKIEERMNSLLLEISTYPECQTLFKSSKIKTSDLERIKKLLNPASTQTETEKEIKFKIAEVYDYLNYLRRLDNNISSLEETIFQTTLDSLNEIKNYQELINYLAFQWANYLTDLTVKTESYLTHAIIEDLELFVSNNNDKSLNFLDKDYKWVLPNLIQTMKFLSTMHVQKEKLEFITKILNKQ